MIASARLHLMILDSCRSHGHPYYDRSPPWLVCVIQGGLISRGMLENCDLMFRR